MNTSALVISLDFELHWGFRDRHLLTEGLKEELQNARMAVERLLDVFAARDIHASWATVGLLMLENRLQKEEIFPQPANLPHYKDPSLNPYQESFGENEEEDPYHFAASLVKKIVTTPGQELASHTFSHYYCLEPGQDGDSFSADMAAATAAAKLHGRSLRSIVYPRNQHNPDYADILTRAGIECYRGNPNHPFYREADRKEDTKLWRRLGRLLDAYFSLSGHHWLHWPELYAQIQPFNVRASRFLRPWSNKLKILEPLKVQRIQKDMKAAAKENAIYHLWWHPHNFASDLEMNMRNLSLILDEYENCRRQYGMVSLNMGEIVDKVKLHSKE